MIKCPYINSTLVDNIAKLVTVKNLNSAEVIAGVNGYLTRHPAVTLEQLLSDRTTLNTVMQSVRDRQRSKEQLIDKLWVATKQYTRDEVALDENTLYIFTDNTDRDSGSNEIADDSWYAKKYGKGHHYPTATTAILRGLDNARPISTQRWYHEGAKGNTGRWTDADFDEFKQVIDDEFDSIEEAWKSGKFKTIVLPKNDLFNSSISGLNSTRTPKLYNYLLEKYMKLVDMTVEGTPRDNSKVGEANLTIIDSKSYQKSIDKMTVAKTPDTLYIYTESAQQRQALTGEKSPMKGVEDIEEDKRNNALNKSTSSGIVRTDVNGNPNKNAMGLITRKNRNGVSQARMTEDDFETWKQVIDTDIQAIKEALFGGKFKRVVFPSSITGELSRQMADYLQDQLQKELGILSQVISTQGDKFKVELNPVVAPKKSSSRPSSKGTETTEEKNVKTAKEKRIEAAKESLTGQRPTEVMAVESDLTNTLLQAFPDIHERKAKVDFITTKFSDDLTWLIESELEYLNSISEEDLDTQYKDTSLTYRQMKDGLTRGDYSKIRLFALENLRVEILDFDDNLQGYRSIMDNFFHIKSQNEEDYMDGTMWAMVKAVAGSEVDELTEVLQDESSYLGKYFMLEAAQKGWTKSSDTLAKRASARAAHLKSVFETLSDEKVWAAVLDESRFDLDVNEGIVITDIQFSPSKEELENSELDEENLNVGKMDFIMKYRLRDPWTTLSAKMKSVLSSITKMKRGYNGAIEVMFNDLGMPIRMNSSYVYYVLLNELSDSISIEDFDNKLDMMLVKYPWMSSIVSKVKVTEGKEDEFDFDLRKEFYRAANKAYVQYGYVSGNNGKFTSCNVTSASEVLFDNIQKNYEGGVILSEKYSVYDEYGRPSNNIAAILGSFSNARKLRDRELLKVHSPLLFAETVLRDFAKAATPDLSRLADALAVLRGDKVPTRDKNGNVTGETTPNKITLEELLKAIGIDTDDLDINSLVPSLESTDDYSFSLSPTTGDVMRVNNETEEVEVALTRSQIGRLSTLLNVIKETINNFNNTGNPLVQDNKARVQLIASIVGVVSEGFTQNMFRFGDKSRPSYTAPNFIDRMTGTIRLSSETEALEYIYQNFTKFDFFKDNQLLNSMTDIRSKGSSFVAEILRKNFSYVQLLAIGGRDTKNEIQRVSKEALLEGIINMYFSANSDAGINFAYYRNPLFSDADAMTFFKLRRYTAEQEYDDEGNLATGDYKERIIKYLVQSVKQELKRISAVRKRTNGRNVEYFNEGGTESRGAQFNFFPEFNKKEVFEELMDMYEFNEDIESEGQWEDRVNKELTNRIRALLEAGFKKLSTSVSESFKISLYDRLHNESKDTDKSQIGNEDDVLDIDGFDEEEDSEDSEDSENNQSKLEEKAAKLSEAESYLEEFFYNDYFAQNQLIQILGGDLAYYKNFTDFIKRNKQAFAGGERLYYQDKDGNELVERGLYVKDVYRASNTFSELSKMLDEIEGLGIVEKGLLKKSFASICLTDGQSFRVLDSFKTLFEAMGGKWTQDMNDTYQRLQNKTFNREDFKTFLNAIKPFVFTYEESEHNGRLEKIVTQHKNSEYLLSAAFSFLNSPVNQSTALQALQEFMERDDVGLDVVHFHSVVKEGFNNSIDISHDPEKFAAQAENGFIRVGNKKIDAPSYSKFIKNLGAALVNEEITSEEYNKAIDNLEFSTKEAVMEYLEKQLMVEVDGMTYIRPEMVHEVPLRDYMVMQPTDDHLVDTQALEGSQGRNIIPADLPETFTMTVNINGKSTVLNREQAIAYYNELHDRQYIESFEKLAKSFSDMKSVEGMLQSAMRQQPAKFSSDFRRAATIDTTGEEFWIPFNTPLMTGKIEDLFLSNFKNHIQNQRINGGNAVLVSNVGLHDKLHVKYKVVKDADGKEHKAVEYIPCYLSYTMKDQLEDFLTEADDGTFSLDYEEMKRALGKDADSVLEAIGYRIPTEDKYSMFPLRIAGFMPSIGGSVIMLPSDIITMSGTDFDIDKLFIMLKTLRRETYDRRQLAYEYNKWLSKNQLDSNSEMKEFFEAWDGFLEEEERDKGKTRPEILNAIEEAETESFTDERTIKRLTRGSHGMTDQEVESLRANSETFNAFMDELGYTLKFDKPSYKILTPKPVTGSHDNLDLESTLRNSTKEERDNMIIDFMFKTLTSPEGSRLMMRMGHFTSPKNSSRQQRIMNSPATLAAFLKLRCKGDVNLLYRALSEPQNPENTLWEELEDFYNKFSEVVNPMDITGYVSTRKNLMDGNDLIGILALNSSAHYKLQFLNLKLKEGNQVVFNGMVLDKIDQVYSPVNGKRIGELCAQLQAAAPDNGKDPCLGDMNLSPATADLAGFLVRLGIDIEDIGMILNATDLFNYGKQIAKENKVRLADKHRTFDLNMNELTAVRAKLKLGQELTEEDKSFMKMFYIWRTKVEKSASQLALLSPVLRCDSSNGALSSDMATAIRQILTFEKTRTAIQNEDYPIEGVRNLVDFTLDPNDKRFLTNGVFDKEKFEAELKKAPIPRLQAVYSLGFVGARGLLENRLSQFSRASFNRMNTFMAFTDLDLRHNNSIPIIKQLLSEYNMFLLTRHSLFGKDDEHSLIERRNYYIHDFPIKLKVMLQLKDSEGNYRYPHIRNLEAIRRLSNRNNRGIKMDNMGKIRPEIRKWYTESFDQLINMGDNISKEERELAKKLAVDLALYSFFDNGMTFRHNSFSNFFSSVFLSSIPGLIDAYREVDSRVAQSEPIMDSRFIMQFIMNHPESARKLKHKQITWETGRDNEAFRLKIDKEGTFPPNSRYLIRRENGTVEQGFLPIIALKIKGKYELFASNGDQSNPIYTRIEGRQYAQGKPDGTLIYDATRDVADIDYKSVKDRGDSNFKVSELAKGSKRKSRVSEDLVVDNFNDDPFAVSSQKNHSVSVTDPSSDISFDDNAEDPYGSSTAGFASSDDFQDPYQSVGMVQYASNAARMEGDTVGLSTGNLWSKPNWTSTTTVDLNAEFDKLDSKDHGLCK